MFTPEWTVEETIEALRESVKRNLVTYIWVVDGEGRLAGIVNMRDLLFGAKDATLARVMTQDPFVLQAKMPLREAMKQVLDRHYPVYPVVDAAGRLTGLVRGQAMFEARAAPPVARRAQAGRRTAPGLETARWCRSR